MTYVLETKADWPDPAVADPDPAALDAEQDAVEHEWAGDLYESGDETDPLDAYAVFTGANGEEAWLDRAPDGTLTGWVRDTDSSVYRYSDADSWATDVDDSGMSKVEAGTYENDEEADDAEAEEAELADSEVPADEAPAEGEEPPTDGELTEEVGDEVDPFADPEGDELEDDATDDGGDENPFGESDDDTEDESDEGDDEEEDDFIAKMKRGREGKSYLMTFRDDR